MNSRLFVNRSYRTHVQRACNCTTIDVIIGNTNWTDKTSDIYEHVRQT